MKPLKNYVLVKQAEKETTTESGLIITGGSSAGPKPGLVEAVGPDAIDDIKVGEKVVLAWDKGLKVDSNKVLIADDFIVGVY